MQKFVYLPKWGMTMTEATVGNWLKSEGDDLVEGEDIVEVETDKVVNTIQSPITGTLVSILVNSGETVEVGAKLAVIASKE